MFPCNQRHEWNFDCLWNIHQIVARLPGLYLFRQLIRTHTAPATSISSSSFPFKYLRGCFLDVSYNSFYFIFSYFPFCRPDLVDWRSLKNRGIRDRLESAFNIVEREYGVTRLLDPEGKANTTHTHTQTTIRRKKKGNHFVRKSAFKERRTPNSW